MIKLIIAAALSGLVFGLGLIIAGMADPSKVLAFLDITGTWNPSLAFVMLGAIAISALPFRLMQSRSVSFLGKDIQLPSKREIDARLIIGSMLFGIGWGIAGICPGPGLVLLGAGIAKGVGFVLAMIIGMLAVDRFTTN
jgi:hypothetical protein